MLVSSLGQHAVYAAAVAVAAGQQANRSARRLDM